MRLPLPAVRSLYVLIALVLFAAPALGQCPAPADGPLADLALGQAAGPTPSQPAIHARVTTDDGMTLEVAFSEGSAVHLKHDEAETRLRLTGSVEADGSVALTLEEMAPSADQAQASETLRLTLGGEARAASIAPLTFDLVEVSDAGTVGTAAANADTVGLASYRLADNTGPGGGPARCCTYCAGWQGCCEVWTPGACCHVYSPCNGYCQACAPNVQTVP